MSLYIGLNSNELWAGELSDEETVRLVCQREGPSGKNKDYLYNLAEAMRQSDPSDRYLYRLEDMLREVDKDKGQKKMSQTNSQSTTSTGSR